MEQIKINAGKLKSAAYDPKQRELHITLDNGVLLIYQQVPCNIWESLKRSGSAWSFYRDNIEETFSVSQRRATNQNNNSNPLDALFDLPQKNE